MIKMNYLQFLMIKIQSNLDKGLTKVIKKMK